MSLKDKIAVDDRPREKALAHGFANHSPAELLAVIIGSASAKEDVVKLCQRILNDHDNKLYNIARRSVVDLSRQYHGVGEVKALQILAAIELAKRYQSEQFDNGTTLHDIEDAYRIFRPLISDLPHEEIWIVTLSRQNRITGKFRVSQGGTAAAATDVKIILRIAIEQMAESIILAHNHPSDTPRPSGPDDNLTAAVYDGCKAIGINLLDHIIVCRGGRYYSYLDQGRLKGSTSGQQRAAANHS